MFNLSTQKYNIEGEELSIFFQEIPTAFSGGGAALIFVALLISGISKIYDERKKTNDKKEKMDNK